MSIVTEELNPDTLRMQLHQVLMRALNLPRHPRSFKGHVEPDEVIVVLRYRDPVTGNFYVADPLELEPGQGETPEPDLFLRDFVSVGSHRGTPLTELLVKSILPAVQNEVSDRGGWLAVLGTIKGLFSSKKK